MSARGPRNPFTSRASELIESDDTFLRLFDLEYSIYFK